MIETTEDYEPCLASTDSLSSAFNLTASKSRLFTNAQITPQNSIQAGWADLLTSDVSMIKLLHFDLTYLLPHI